MTIATRDLGPHFEEIRKRILRSSIVIGAIIVFLITFHAESIDVLGVTLYYPTPEPLNNIAAQVTAHMRNTLVPENVQLIQTAPGQAFFAQVYVAALVSIVCAMPIIIRESVGFLAPALRETEIKISKSVAIPSLILFIIGCVFAYLAVIPYILDFLYTYGESAGLVTFLNVMDFVGFVLQFLLAFGISFQLPLIMYAFTASGMTVGKFWRKNIRYSIIIIIIFGAVITPDGSGVTMWFISGPMLALYVAGMIIAERHEKKKNPPIV